ncbi:MAG: inorganic pyrophosphatase [Cystobacterineae bacterium]|nr:inorganic pyrophosphatase [Cystobacterineae bacterium]
MPKKLEAHFFSAHPWHGVSPGDNAPEQLTCYVEMVPTDAVKYELDKASGLLKVDRPQKYSNVPPSLYGFVPRSLCAERVAKRCVERTGHKGVQGDMDPIDVCILTEKTFTHGNILVEAIPVGGFRMLDGNDVDDKIICVLKGDAVFGGVGDVSQVTTAMIDRLRHYFLTYKQSPHTLKQGCQIVETYGRDEALEVLKRSFADYVAHYAQAPVKVSKP